MSQQAEELTEMFYPLIQKWEEDFNSLLLKWIEDAKDNLMPFPILRPLIRLVVDTHIQNMEEFEGGGEP
ncbi:MAG: hypothetical protein KGD60_14495 [Candidatus Thorarchaeota archaeon]|nr:hypothetical protein [Candidatus Thorarchaeota archaeon]